MLGLQFLPIFKHIPTSAAFIFSENIVLIENMMWKEEGVVREEQKKKQTIRNELLQHSILANKSFFF